MEPRSVDRGNARACSWILARCSLQWSRDQLIAEIQPPGAQPQPLRQLQWSRDQLIAEIFPLRPRRGLRPLASMEPRSVDRGNLTFSGRRCDGRVASMEP